MTLNELLCTMYSEQQIAIFVNSIFNEKCEYNAENLVVYGTVNEILENEKYLVYAGSDVLFMASELTERMNTLKGNFSELFTVLTVLI